MQEKIQEFKTFLRTDPRAKIKIAFIVGSGLFVISLVFVLYSVNFGNLGGGNTGNLNNQTEQLPQVTQQTFGSSSNLTPVGTENLLINSQNQIIQHEQNSYLTAQASFDKLSLINLSQPNRPSIDIDMSRELVNPSYDYIANNLIINDITGSLVYNFNSSNLLPLEVEFSLQPVSEQEIFYLENFNNRLVVRKARDINNLQSISNYGSLSLSPEMQMAELRVYNGKPWLFIFNSVYAEGVLNIYQYNSESNSYDLFLTQDNIHSIAYGEAGFMLTYPDNALNNSFYTSRIYNFASGNSPRIINLENLSELLEQRQILGNLLAQRCNLDTNSSTLSCLVKQTAVNALANEAPDSLIVYNWQTQDVQRQFENIFFSARLLFSRPNLAGRYFIQSGFNNQFYELKLAN